MPNDTARARMVTERYIYDPRPRLHVRVAPIVHPPEPQPPEADLTLTDYATKELTLAGLFDKDSDYDGMLGTAALDIVKLFASQGHSGMSASIVTELVGRLMRYEPITPLTYGPEEWNEVERGKTWQSNRDPKVFSYDHGKTHTRLGESS